MCGGEVVQRADDTPEAITKRLEAYERDTVPAIERVRRAAACWSTSTAWASPTRCSARLIAAIDARAHCWPGMKMARAASCSAPPAEIAVMRRAGRVVAEMHERIRGGDPPGRRPPSSSTRSAAT